MFEKVHAKRNFGGCYVRGDFLVKGVRMSKLEKVLGCVQALVHSLDRADNIQRAGKGISDILVFRPFGLVSNFVRICKAL